LIDERLARDTSIERVSIRLAFSPRPTVEPTQVTVGTSVFSLGSAVSKRRQGDLEVARPLRADAKVW
jgi:hypothetical protein